MATLNKNNDVLVKKLISLALENKFDYYLPNFFEECETHYFRDKNLDEIGNSIWIQLDPEGVIHFNLIFNDDDDNIFNRNIMVINANEDILMKELFGFLLEIHSNKN